LRPDITGFQYPLTEENLIEKLRLWALPEDPAPG
jgi:hypothetical protein